MSDQSKSQTDHNWLDALEAIATTAVFVAAVAAGLIGAAFGHWETLVLIPIGWLFAALDPKIGRWRHVWE